MLASTDAHASAIGALVSAASLGGASAAAALDAVLGQCQAGAAPAAATLLALAALSSARPAEGAARAAEALGRALPALASFKQDAQRSAAARAITALGVAVVECIAERAAANSDSGSHAPAELSCVSADEVAPLFQSALELMLSAWLPSRQTAVRHAAARAAGAAAMLAPQAALARLAPQAAPALLTMLRKEAGEGRAAAAAGLSGVVRAALLGKRAIDGGGARGGSISDGGIVGVNDFVDFDTPRAAETGSAVAIDAELTAEVVTGVLALLGQTPELGDGEAAAEDYAREQAARADLLTLLEAAAVAWPGVAAARVAAALEADDAPKGGGVTRSGGLTALRHLVSSPASRGALSDQAGTLVGALRRVAVQRTRCGVALPAGEVALRLALVQTAMALAAHGWLRHAGGGALVEFLVAQCCAGVADAQRAEAAASREGMSAACTARAANDGACAELRRAGRQAVELVASTVSSDDVELWPLLLQLLVPAEYTSASGVVAKAAAEVLKRRADAGLPLMADQSVHPDAPSAAGLLGRALMLLLDPLAHTHCGIRLLEVLHLVAPELPHAEGKLGALWRKRVTKMARYLRDAAQAGDGTAREELLREPGKFTGDLWELSQDDRRAQHGAWGDALDRFLCESIEAAECPKFACEVLCSLEAQMVAHEAAVGPSVARHCRGSLLRLAGATLRGVSETVIARGALARLWRACDVSVAEERIGLADGCSLAAGAHCDLVLDMLREALDSTDARAKKSSGGFFSIFGSSDKDKAAERAASQVGVMEGKADAGGARACVSLALARAAAGAPPALLRARVETHIAAPLLRRLLPAADSLVTREAYHVSVAIMARAALNLPHDALDSRDALFEASLQGLSAAASAVGYRVGSAASAALAALAARSPPPPAALREGAMTAAVGVLSAVSDRACAAPALLLGSLCSAVACSHDGTNGRQVAARCAMEQLEAQLAAPCAPPVRVATLRAHGVVCAAAAEAHGAFDEGDKEASRAAVKLGARLAALLPRLAEDDPAAREAARQSAALLLGVAAEQPVAPADVLAGVNGDPKDKTFACTAGDKLGQALADSLDGAEALACVHSACVVAAGAAVSRGSAELAARLVLAVLQYRSEEGVREERPLVASMLAAASASGGNAHIGDAMAAATLELARGARPLAVLDAVLHGGAGSDGAMSRAASAAVTALVGDAALLPKVFDHLTDVLLHPPAPPGSAMGGGSAVKGSKRVRASPVSVLATPRITPASAASSALETPGALLQAGAPAGEPLRMAAAAIGAAALAVTDGGEGNSNSAEGGTLASLVRRCAPQAVAALVLRAGYALEAGDATGAGEAAVAMAQLGYAATDRTDRTLGAACSEVARECLPQDPSDGDCGEQFAARATAAWCQALGADVAGAVSMTLARALSRPGGGGHGAAAAAVGAAARWLAPQSVAAAEALDALAGGTREGAAEARASCARALASLPGEPSSGGTALQCAATRASALLAAAADAEPAVSDAALAALSALLAALPTASALAVLPQVGAPLLSLLDSERGETRAGALGAYSALLTASNAADEGLAVRVAHAVVARALMHAGDAHKASRDAAVGVVEALKAPLLADARATAEADNAARGGTALDAAAAVEAATSVLRAALSPRASALGASAAAHLRLLRPAGAALVAVFPRRAPAYASAAHAAGRGAPDAALRAGGLRLAGCVLAPLERAAAREAEVARCGGVAAGEARRGDYAQIVGALVCASADAKDAASRASAVEAIGMVLAAPAEAAAGVRAEREAQSSVALQGTFAYSETLHATPVTLEAI